MHILRIGLEPTAAIDIAPAELRVGRRTLKKNLSASGSRWRRRLRASPVALNCPRGSPGISAECRDRGLAAVQPESLAGLRRKRCLRPLGKLS
jgi:hypothetical protein